MSTAAAKGQTVKLFFAERRGGLGWEGEVVCPRCGKSTVFLNPTADRRAFYEQGHRCEGRTWQGRP